ncbi:hypothetical protein EUTSA_v10013474mg [Eutrema salsugineum]|uniref:F-box domain-containing protein n=1 Tax=Eutrema salsugineum TaxID=72664 RepID=V4LES4_EUTSA|nr:hypothetical protein EUTSA_v10013474mg [Eutrema salsugineum]
MEERKEKRLCHQRPAREDLISKLPDSLISQILLYLPTEEAVRTSVLSNRWKSLWLSIPGLDLDSRVFPNYKVFVRIMDKFVDLSRQEKSYLHKLKLSIRKGEYDEYCVTRWIDFVATPKLWHLDFECGPVDPDCLEVMPESLYICESLLHLRLHRAFLDSFESVSLPCLKTMRLELNVYAKDTCLESLISSCPVLEDLSIVRRVDDNVKVLRVRSQTLTTLTVSFDFGDYGSELSRFDRGNSGLLFDAPRLKYLNFFDELSKSKIISNLSSLAKADFAGFFDVQYHSDGAGLSKNQLARNFFTGISRVRDMIISGDTMKFFYSYLKIEPLPQFWNLSCLEAGFCSSHVKILPTLLESCPNLKSIVLDLTHCMMLTDPLSCSSVPQCLLSSLKYAEIKSRFTGRCVEREVASYLVKNSVVLKKLVVHLSSSMQQQSLVVLRDILALPMPSSICQIVYVADADT